MSKSSVKKALASLTREQVVDLLLELYSARKDAKEYLDFFADPDPEAERDKVLTVVAREMRRGAWGRSNLRVSRINDAVKRYSTLGIDPPEVLALRLDVCRALVGNAIDRRCSDTIVRGTGRFIKQTLDLADKIGIFGPTVDAVDAILDDIPRYPSTRGLASAFRDALA